MDKRITKYDFPKRCLKTIELKNHYTICKQIGFGAFSKTVLARCKLTDKLVVLKLITKSSTTFKDFHAEFNVSYFLSAHPFIVDTYDVSFQTRDTFLFAMEYATYGDLYKIIKARGCITESQTKQVAKQVASALEFMHSENLVHRDVKPENILVYDENLSRVKIADFGLCRAKRSLIRKVDGYAPYSPPEIIETVKNETFVISKSEDSWALGVMLYACMTGKFAWASASATDPRYSAFCRWQKLKSKARPRGWQDFSSRFMKLVNKLLEPKSKLRAAVTEVNKYLTDSWIINRKDSEVTCESSDASGLCESTTDPWGILDDQTWQKYRVSQWVLQLSN